MENQIQNKHRKRNITKNEYNSRIFGFFGVRKHKDIFPYTKPLNLHANT